jgi:uncharacterized membrane protein
MINQCFHRNQNLDHIKNHINPSYISAFSDIHLTLFSHTYLGFLTDEVLLPKCCMNFTFHSGSLILLFTIYLSYSLIVKSKVQHHQYQTNVHQFQPSFILTTYISEIHHGRTLTSQMPLLYVKIIIWKQF